MTEQRGFIGSVYRFTAEWLAANGLFGEVSGRASPTVRRLLEKPPSAFSWQGPSELEEIQQIVYSLSRGPELCVELGHVASTRLAGSIIRPVLQMALSLFGTSPATVFGNLDRFYSMAARGFTFTYEERGTSAGVVQALIRGPGIPEASFEVTRGNLLTVFDLCSTKGTIARPEVVRHDQAGALLRLAVQWQ